MVSLSVCVFSDQSPARLAAIVAPLRSVASEIVVVLDDRIPNPDLTPLHEVADKAFAAPFKWPLETNLEWLHAQCSGDWVLRLDGDEVPSRALVDLLAGDDWHRDVTHCRVPRRWLVEEGASWIESNPWWPDLQVRLIKNEPGPMGFGSGVHEPVDTAGPGRVLAAAIYHLDLIDTDVVSRRAKSRRYYRARPELRTFGGLAMGTYYTPELVTPDPAVAPVPSEDRLFVRAALVEDHCMVPQYRDSTPEIDPAAGTVQPVSITVAHVDRSGYAGRGLEIFVTAANTGIQALDPSADHPFRIGCQWTNCDGITAPEEGRAALPCLLESGGSETVVLPVKIPSTAGEYTLSIGAVEEGKRWFCRIPSIRFTVINQPQVTLVGGYSPFRHLGDDLIMRSLIEDLTDEFPQLRLTLLADDPDAIADRFQVPADHTAVGIHYSHTSQGLTGPESVDLAMSIASRHLAGERVENASIATLTDVIGRSDAFVIAAAGSLTSAYVDAILWPRLIEAEMADAVGVPVVITSAGMGPFTTDGHRDGARRLLDIARELHVRDRRSLHTVADVGAQKPITTVFPDAASSFRGAEGTDFAEFLVKSGIPEDRPYLVASVRGDDDANTIEQVAESVQTAAHTLGAVAVLMPHCASDRADDRPALDALAGLLANGVDVVNLADIPADPLAADLVRHASISIGSRFHNAVLSASAARPAILFPETEYDEWRAQGLAAMPGVAVSVMSASRGSVARPTREILDRRATQLRYERPHPLVAVIRTLDILR